MAIPFLDFFKKKGAKTQGAEPAAPKKSAIEKPSSERLSKTVVPNAARSLPRQDTFHTPAVTMPSVSPGPARAYSLGGTASANTNRTNDLPPAVALAIEPKVERVIALSLGEVVDQIPGGWVRPVSEAEADRRILLKAAEIEKGMSSGKPSVSVGSIYRQVPEIFVRPVPESDSTQVPLPFDKVLEQFKNLPLRKDQDRDQSVPQFETPFLKVTLEDNSKFGVPMGPIQTADMPPVRLEPATARAIADAEPEAAEKIPVPNPVPVSTPPPIPLIPSPSMPATPPQIPMSGPLPAPFAPAQTPPPVSVAAAAPVAPPAEKPAPTRIPFKLSPTGPGAPASERVPASSGPSVPKVAPAGAPRERIPFKILPPAAAPAKAEPWLTKDNFESEAEAAQVRAEQPPLPNESSKTAVKISLPLKPVMQNLPPFQLTGDISRMPDEARFELPFSLIEPQLASGRINLQPDEFAAALPNEYKALFSAKEIATPIALPLQDVLKNLPSASLRMREDQEEQEKGEDFATPFSAKAEEDAKRFNLSPSLDAKPPKEAEALKPKAPAPASEQREAVARVFDPKPLSEAPPPVAPAPAVPTAEPAPQAAPPLKLASAAEEPLSLSLEKNSLGQGRSALQSALNTDEEVDAKAVVAHVGKMAGVKACAIMFSDGLSLAGNLPEIYQADGLCAMAPALLQKVENHMMQTKLGALRSMTLSCAQAAVTFFMHDNLCLGALHSKDELAADVREQLARAVNELSKKYSKPV